MRKYDLLTIFRPNLDNDEVDKLLEAFDAELEKFGGKLESRDKIGRKKLAYDIQKFRDGFMVSQLISLPADKVADLKRSLKLNDNVLRIMLLEASEKASV